MDKKTAEAKAQALVDVMGPQWEPRVWRNMGYHYEIRRKLEETGGGVSLRGAQGRYRCLISFDRCGTGEISFEIQYRDTPQEAFDAALEELSKYADKVAKLKNFLENKE